MFSNHRKFSRNAGTVRSAAAVLCAVLLAGCGGAEQEDGGNAVPGLTGVTREMPVSSLTAADGHLVYITLDDCYPADQSVVAVADPENRLPTFSGESSMKKYYENAQILTYDEDLGGYGVLLEEGLYEISLICDAPDVTYSQSRYITVDAEHSYYHVRFTGQAYVDFD